MIRRLSLLSVALVTALWVSLPASALAQCAMCGTAIQSEDDPLSRGLLWSVVFLISLPYTIVLCFVVGIYFAWRRTKSPPPEQPALRLVAGSGLNLAPRKENQP
jgi:hypothetical protein